MAVLVPLTGSNATIGQGLLKGVQLAMADGGPQLDVRDTAGTPTGATAAAQAALAARDQVIIGPLTQGETAAVAAVAAGTPVLAFTSDRQQARPGVWVLGVTPDQQVTRLVQALQREGRVRIAAVLPDNIFGEALADSLRRRTAEAGLPAPVIRRYPTGRVQALDAAVRDVSGYAAAQAANEARLKDLHDAGVATDDPQSQDTAAEPPAPPPFDALMLAEAGPALRTIAAALPKYGVQQPGVRVVGPATWSRDAANLTGLAGAWYAAPDPSARGGFDAQYAAKNGAPPPPFADIAYDAGNLARVAVANPTQLTQRQGFAGVSGPLVLLPDGNVRRGLAVFEVGDSTARLVQPGS